MKRPQHPLLALALALAAGLLSGMAGPTLAATAPVTPNQVVTAIEGTFGVTPGQRRNHTKGICAAGEFVASPEAAGYSRSQLFAGATIPVVARFSIAGGNPKVPDTARNPRGMALEFRLPDGELQHMTMLNTPVFGAATAQTFLDHMLAIRPDPATGKPDPEKIKAFKASHPDSAAQGAFLSTNNPPPSFANSAFFSIHTFKFMDKDDQTTMVRWRFMPEDGEKHLTDDELKNGPKEFLQQALMDRAKQGPIRWDMWIAIGEEGDSVTDPTQAWPAGRKQVKLGTLTLTEVTPQKGGTCEPINFDPLVMSDGIAATDDPILQFRSPAYAISFAKRLSEQ